MKLGSEVQWWDEVDAKASSAHELGCFAVSCDCFIITGIAIIAMLQFGQLLHIDFIFDGSIWCHRISEWQHFRSWKICKMIVLPEHPLVKMKCSQWRFGRDGSYFFTEKRFKINLSRTNSDRFNLKLSEDQWIWSTFPKDRWWIFYFHMTNISLE